MLSLFCYTTSAIGLTEFSKQLIDLYIGTNQIPNNEDMVVHIKTDTLYYRVFLYSVDPDISLSGDEYLGKVKYNNRLVYVFGQQNDVFHTGEKVVPSELKVSEKSDGIIQIFDPIEWEIFIDKRDLKLNKQFTNTNIIICRQDGQFTTGMDSTTLVLLEKIVNIYNRRRIY